MRFPTQKRKPAKVQLASFPAPIAGWVSNRSLAVAQAGAPGAAVLENFFPTSTGIVLRRGCRRWATTEGSPIVSMFTYINGNQDELFAASATRVYNITVIQDPYAWLLVANSDDEAISPDPGNEVVFGSASALDHIMLDNQEGGDWVTVQMATAGGSFLIGVNGENDGFRYDGTTWESLDSVLTFPEGSTLTSADFSYVWVYQNRIWFIQKDSLVAWYLAVDSVGGTLTALPMGGNFQRGGVLLLGQSWSLPSGGSGGLSDQCIFITTEGEVSAYQGINPSQASSWDKVGTYRIGRPMGKKALIRAGGDLVIATSTGFISLAAASQLDFAALGQNALSHPIEDAWNKAVDARGQTDWRCQVWAKGQMTMIAPPTPDGYEPIVFVCNTVTGAWASITGWDCTAFEGWRGGIYFGSRDGAIRQGWVGGSDEELPYTGYCLPLFDSLNAPTSIKVARVARVSMRSAYPALEKATAKFNFDMSAPPPPNQLPVPAGNEWDNAIWDQSIWNSDRAGIYSNVPRSVGGSGVYVSVAVQVSSNSPVPLDVEIVDTQLTYETAGIIT